MIGATDPTREPAAADARTLHDKVNHGLRWSFVQQLVARLISVGSGIVLAHILVPKDFGVYAVALTMTNVLFGFNDLGLSLAVMRWPGDPRMAARTAMTMSTGSSVGLFVLSFLVAPWLADVMGSPQAVGPLRLLSLAVVIDGLTSVHQGLLVRNFRQDRLAIAEFAATPVGVGLTIGLAAAGAGAWSLAIGQVVANGVTATMMIAFAPFRPRFGFQAAIARKLLSYGFPLACASLLGYCLLNADYIIVGNAIGPVALGLYVLAYNISNWPSSLIMEGIRKVSFVGFHELEGEPDRLARGFERVMVLLVTLALPIVLAVSLLAEPLVTEVYGDRWRAAATALQFLAILGGARVVTALVFDLLVGTGHSRQSLLLSLVWAAALVPALLAGVRLDGMRGVAIAHVIVALLVAIPVSLNATRRLGVNLRTIGRELVRPAVAAAVAAATVISLRPMVHGAWAELLVLGGLFGVMYAAIGFPREWFLIARRTVFRPPPVAMVEPEAS